MRALEEARDGAAEGADPVEAEADQGAEVENEEEGKGTEDDLVILTLIPQEAEVAAATRRLWS